LARLPLTLAISHYDHVIELVTGRVPVETVPNPENLAYLRTKRERMGHLLEGLDEFS